MKLEHQFTVPASADVTWAAVIDPARVAPCMPGATLTEVNDSEFSGTVKVKLGPVSLLYKGSGQFIEVDEQARRVVIKASGKDSRGNGTAAATVTLTLRDDGDTTHGDVVTDLNITGKPAQFGRGMISEVGGKILDTFADCLAKKLGGGESESAPAEKPAPRRRTSAASKAAAAAAAASATATTAATAATAATSGSTVSATADAPNGAPVPTETKAAADKTATKLDDTAAKDIAAPSAPKPDAPKPAAAKSDAPKPDAAKPGAPEPGAGAAEAAADIADEVAKPGKVAEPSEPVKAADPAQPAPEKPKSTVPPAAPTPSKPTLHAVSNEPETDAIDLMDYAGASIAKRAIPAAAVLVLLFVLWRVLRRR